MVESAAFWEQGCHPAFGGPVLLGLLAWTGTGSTCASAQCKASRKGVCVLPSLIVLALGRDGAALHMPLVPPRSPGECQSC